MASCPDAPLSRRARRRCRRARRGLWLGLERRAAPSTSTNATASTNDDTGSASPAAGHARRPGAACAWSRSATSRARSTSPRRPATGGGSSWSSRRGGSSSCAAAGPSPSRSSTSARRSPPAASRACSRWPSPRTTRSRGASTSTTPRRAAARRSGSTTAPAHDRADPGSARLVLRMDDPEPNHNGGLMVFGPDKLMYVGTGDGGGGNDQHGAAGNAQSLSSPLGKILRIDPRASGGRPYTIPSVEPVRRARGRARRDLLLRAAQPVALLLRPRQRRPRHRRRRPGRGRGDRLRQEGRAARGANFGWRPWEGRRRNFDEPAPGAVFPVITHTHQAGFCSITGGYVVRDRGVPGLYGRYVYGDFCNSQPARGHPAHRARVEPHAVGAHDLRRLVVRRGRRRARLRDVAQRPGLPLRGALTARHGAGAPRRVGRARDDAQRVEGRLEVAGDVGRVGHHRGVGVDAAVQPAAVGERADRQRVAAAGTARRGRSRSRGARAGRARPAGPGTLETTALNDGRARGGARHDAPRARRAAARRPPQRLQRRGAAARLARLRLGVRTRRRTRSGRSRRRAARR